MNISQKIEQVNLEIAEDGNRVLQTLPSHRWVPYFEDLSSHYLELGGHQVAKGQPEDGLISLFISTRYREIAEALKEEK